MIPNILSSIRILLVPLFLFFFFSEINNSKFISLIIFIVASLTDFLDGLIARKFNLITKLGKFLDPLADKILTISVFYSFLILDIISYWMFFLIISRDIIVTIIRIFFNRYHLTFVTSNVAKIKTTIQIISIIYVLSMMSQTSIQEIFLLNDFLYSLNLLLIELKNFIPMFSQKSISWLFLSITSIVTFYTGLHYIYAHREGLIFLINKNKF